MANSSAVLVDVDAFGVAFKRALIFDPTQLDDINAPLYDFSSYMQKIKVSHICIQIVKYISLLTAWVMVSQQNCFLPYSHLEEMTVHSSLNSKPIRDHPEAQ
jgi:hypothetical protein